MTCIVRTECGKRLAVNSQQSHALVLLLRELMLTPHGVQGCLFQPAL
jgi:hypothetical protein